MPGWSHYVGFLEWSLNGIAETVNSGGLAIVIFTIIIKTLLMPLTVKALRSSKAMMELQPKIKELQKKYGKDRQELSKQTMQLYQQYQVNPLAGCLPMLIQIPIFFGVYRAIYHLTGGDTGHWADPFLWLPSLGNPDPIFVMPILAGAFQFVQTQMSRPANQPKATDPQQQIMNVMLNWMPLMVVIFGWTFASGAVLYWVTQSVYGVVQQWFITGWGRMNNWIPNLPELPEHRRLGYKPPRDLDDIVVTSGERPPAKGISGWFQKRLEDAQKRAEEQQAARKEAVTTTSDTTEETIPSAATTAVKVNAASKGKRRQGKSSYQSRVDQASRKPVGVTNGAAAVEVDAETDLEDDGPTPIQSGRSGRSSYQARVEAASRKGPRSAWKDGTRPTVATAGADGDSE